MKHPSKPLRFELLEALKPAAKPKPPAVVIQLNTKHEPAA